MNVLSCWGRVEELAVTFLIRWIGVATAFQMRIYVTSKSGGEIRGGLHVQEAAWSVKTMPYKTSSEHMAGKVRAVYEARYCMSYNLFWNSSSAHA